MRIVVPLILTGVLAASCVLMCLDVVAALLVALAADGVLMRVDVFRRLAFVAPEDPVPILLLLRHLGASFGIPAVSRNVVHMTLGATEIFHPLLKNTSHLPR